MEEIDNNSSNESTRDVEAKYLPDEIIIQHILPWLPLKPLIRSKLISKQWNVNVNFFLENIKYSIFSNPFTPIESLFIQSDNNTFYIYTCNSHDHGDNTFKYVSTRDYNLVELRPNFYVGKNGNVRLVGSCNGLVCLGELTYGKYFILWNPSTKQSCKYNYPEEYCMEQSCKEILWGFGYVSSVDDYKVVRVSQFRSRAEVYSVYVFSLRSNSWSRIEFGMGECKLVGRSRLVNETLYWRKVNDDENVEIVSFDLGVETFAMLPDLAIRAPRNAVLSVMGGCLSVCVHNSDTNDLVMHIVKKLGRVVKVVYSGLRKNDRFADLIGMTQSGKIFIVYPRCCVICLVVSCSDKSIVTFEDNARQWSTCMDSYVQSLVSPLPPPELPNASGQVA